MADVELSIRVADYAPVKAVIDAAVEVCEAEGSQPWTLTQAIEALRERLEALPSACGHDDEDDGN